MKKIYKVLSGILLLSSLCSCGKIFESKFEEIPAGEIINLSYSNASKYLKVKTNVTPIKKDDGSNLYTMMSYSFSCKGYDVMTYFDAFVEVEVSVNIIGSNPNVELLTYKEVIQLDNNGDGIVSGAFKYREGETFRSFELVGYKYTYGGKCVKINVN